MKTIGIIIIVFAMGMFGWLGVENEKTMKPFLKTAKFHEKEKSIEDAELYCKNLKCEVEKKQNEIIEKLNQ